MNLYAWTYGSYTIYTVSPTPNIHDTIYNSSGSPITSIGPFNNLSITSVANDTMTVYCDIE